MASDCFDCRQCTQNGHLSRNGLTPQICDICTSQHLARDPSYAYGNRRKTRQTLSKTSEASAEDLSHVSCHSMQRAENARLCSEFAANITCHPENAENLPVFTRIRFYIGERGPFLVGDLCRAQTKCLHPLRRLQISSL